MVFAVSTTHESIRFLVADNLLRPPVILSHCKALHTIVRKTGWKKPYAVFQIISGLAALSGILPGSLTCI